MGFVEVQGVDCEPGAVGGRWDQWCAAREAAREAEEIRGTSSISLLSAANQLNQTA